mmetsp:Transcript_49413/g.155453  ORF Transcript_49413/g.155453 Transcript_49413/m.155453 type:complete len:271 (+) Transcript_49413:1-813(+)
MAAHAGVRARLRGNLGEVRLPPTRHPLPAGGPLAPGSRAARGLRRLRRGLLELDLLERRVPLLVEVVHGDVLREGDQHALPAGLHAVPLLAQALAVGPDRRVILLLHVVAGARPGGARRPSWAGSLVFLALLCRRVLLRDGAQRVLGGQACGQRVCLRIPELLAGPAHLLLLEAVEAVDAVDRPNHGVAADAELLLHTVALFAALLQSAVLLLTTCLQHLHLTGQGLAGLLQGLQLPPRCKDLLAVLAVQLSARRRRCRCRGWLRRCRCR